MNNRVGGELPKFSMDLLLLHPPAHFDFRFRRDIYFPYMSTSGAVPVTPLFEYFPIGFKSLQQTLENAGFDVKILNLSSVLLKYPRISVESLFQSLDARLVGIDLHWMVHVQGALAVAELYKEVHPDRPVIFGGISATYYAQELAGYPFIDMVLRGFDTHQPMVALMHALENTSTLASVPNLIWKDRFGTIKDNGFDYQPKTFGCGIDWSQLPEQPSRQSLPIREVMTAHNTGCAYDCGWCGGSRSAYKRITGQKKAMTRKTLPEVDSELRSLTRIPGEAQYHLYSNGFYNESNDRIDFFLDRLGESKIKSVSYEQFHLTSPEIMKKMVAANKRTSITLSPESHDLRISKLAGRGTYTGEELEAWIEQALDIGIHEIDIWYFTGMPEQDARSVMETVDYCGHLLRKFRGQRVVPLLCPMIPFLDPASTFFEEPERHGYRIFFRTVEEHRRGMERASLIHRINYETRWMSRQELVEVGYAAVRSLTEHKVDSGLLPTSIGQLVCDKFDDAVEFLRVVHRIDQIPDKEERSRELDLIGDEIVSRNNEIFFSGVSNQAFPINREIGGRWFDELLWESKTLEDCQQSLRNSIEHSSTEIATANSL